MPSIIIEVDTALDAAYIRLSDKTITRTVAHNDDINIDLDEFGVAVGVEVLSERAPLPFTELVDKYHVRNNVVELLRLIRPDVASYLELTSGNDGTTKVQTADPLLAVA